MMTIPTRVPAPVAVFTVRPPTAEKIYAGQTVAVVGSAVLRSVITLAAAQNTVVLPAALIATPTNGSNAVTVGGTATLTAVYTRTAVGGTTITGVVDAAVVYTRPTAQAVSVTGTATLAVVYRLTATQTVTTTGTTDSAAFLPVDAGQDIATTSTGIVRVDGGSTALTAQGATEVTGTAAVRETRTTPAAATTTVTGTARVVGVVLTGPATNSLTASGTATTRAVYTLTATQAIAVAETGTVGAALTASQAVVTTGSSTVRPFYRLAATNNTGVTATGNVTAKSFTAMRMYKAGTFDAALNSWVKVTGWTADTAAYANSAVANDGLSPGSGAANISARVEFAYPFGTRQFRICRDGVPIATSAASTDATIKSVALSATNVAVGGLLTFEVNCSSSFSGANTVQPGVAVTFLDVSAA